MHENNQLHAHSALRASATTSLALAQVFRRRHRRDTGSGDDDAAVRVYGRGPGPTQDVLGSSSGSDVISISGAETHKDSGKLLLVTVNAAGVPGYPVTKLRRWSHGLIRSRP